MKQTKNAKLFFTSTNPPKKKPDKRRLAQCVCKTFRSTFRIRIFSCCYLAVSLSDASVLLRFFMFNWLHYTLQFGSVSWSSEAVSVVCGHDDGVLASLIAPFFLTVAGAKSKNQRKKFPFFCSHQKNITPIGENAALLKAAHYCTIRGKRSISHKFVSLGLTVRALANAELKNWLDIQYFNCSDARNTFRYSDAFIQYNSSTLIKLMWSIGGKSIFTFSRHTVFHSDSLLFDFRR